LAIKENIEYVKEELTAQEQFLEGMIRSERFVKKYKKPLIGLASVIIVAILGYGVYDYIKTANLEASNIAYNKLLKNPKDTEALKVLQSKNEALYNTFIFHQAVINSDVKELEKFKSVAKDEVLKDLATYQAASIKEHRVALQNYQANSEALLKEFATFIEGYKLLKEGKIDEGKMKLSSIPLNSPLFNIAKSLNHYGITEQKGK